MIRKTVAFANIPVHKSIPNTKYIVDCFNIYIPDCKIFFLSHFHADHYIGLNKKFTGTLFCSQTTASLVHKNLRVIENQIKRLNMFTWYEIEKNHYVYLADANHCPGAVVFIFKIVDRFYFHCGDFRAANEFYNQFGSLKDVEIFDIENKKINEISLVDFYNFNYECIINVNKSFKINEINHEEIGFNNKNFIDLQEIHQLRELKEKNENNTNMKEMHEINQLCEFKERNEINLSEVVLHNIENNGNLLDTKEYFTNEKLGINNTNNFFLQKSLSKLQSNILKSFKLTLLDIIYEKIFLDNTYESFKSFETQKFIIHNILKIIENKLNNRCCLIPVKYKFLFATYSIGKEKIFLSVAEYFNLKIKLEKRKMDLYSCYDRYTIDRLDREVKSIIEDYKANNNEKPLYNSILKYTKCNINKKINDKVEPVKKNKIRKSLPEKKADFFGVFERLVENDYNDNCIELISMMHKNKTKIQEICQKYTEDRICIFVGSGWNEKILHYDFKKENGSIVKKGIEVYYMPYSEHSSNDELLQFKKIMKYDTNINTVKNTWACKN